MDYKLENNSSLWTFWSRANIILKIQCFGHTISIFKWKWRSSILLTFLSQKVRKILFKNNKHYRSWWCDDYISDAENTSETQLEKHLDYRHRCKIASNKKIRIGKISHRSCCPHVLLCTTSSAGQHCGAQLDPPFISAAHFKLFSSHDPDETLTIQLNLKKIYN